MRTVFLTFPHEYQMDAIGAEKSMRL